MSAEEAKRRLTEYGQNQLKEEKGVSPLKILLEQFKQFLIIILLVATLISLFLGEVADAVVIFVIVVASAVLGFVQEYRASRAVEALKKLVTTTVEVVRDDREERIESADVVPGDVMVLSPGDKVTADARVFQVNNFKVNEAALTGEAEPVTKNDLPLPSDTGLYARRNMVFAGTVVTYGRARAVVTSTGMMTEFGRIASMIQTVEEEQTPLEKRMSRLGRTLGIISLIVVAIVFTLGLLRGYGIFEMFLWSVSLAVAAVPEALPAVVTGSLAVGMQMMAKRNAIVKRLPAVETLGSTSVICSDKTGTLTKGEMTVRELYFDWRSVEVTGAGYSPEGEFVGGAPDKESHLVKAALLCNDAKMVKLGDSWMIDGDSTEGALIVLAAKLGADQRALVEQYPRIGEVVFSSERKRMTTINRASHNRLVAYMKGAPEIVLQMCSHLLVNGQVQVMTEKEKQVVLVENEAMAKNALRVLGFAYRELPPGTSRFDEKVEQDMVFTGLMGMIDPPREEAKQAVRLCSEAGIKTVMITGDNRHTAAAVARELGIITNDRVMTGEELERISDDDFDKIVEEVAVYARVSPGDKMRIVKALKKRGRIVAATGDGVNDAPALKAADIGVAMGITGTEATKEAADMILLDDNFATLVSAVERGRVIFANIKKFLAYLLSSNIGELLIMLSAGLTGLPLPLITIQILWVNLVTDGLPAIALGVDPPEADIMKYPPRNPNETVFTPGIKAIVLVVSILMAVIILPVFYLYNPSFADDGLVKARTIVFTSVVMFEMYNTLNCRSEKQSVFRVGVFKNRYLLLAVFSSILLQLLVIYSPQLQPYFGTVSLNLLDWLIIVVISSTSLIGVETAKMFLRGRS
ncbi:MAG: calcium-translocating P-type ATPase, SERCA-type [Thaumarchaeota archaeon]|nr:calcium-translocating P-type ATPase, SERCA-type [Nitrososphaerota archaeon]MCL5317929.1 calcium-translocating P-type ATPase, SERCA-type [Nitrososphaerota archaeon]